MTIEEKAKAYDRVSKEVKDFFEGRKKMYSNVNQTLEYLFPELKESEDERTRKELLSVVNDLVLPDEQQSRFVAWIEKQGQHKKFRDSIQVGDKVTRNEDGVLVNLSQLNRVAKKDEKQGEQKPTDVRTTGYWLVEDTEQKPADKVEPKFHEGEWVVTDKNNVVQIKAIEDSKYVLENTMRFSVDYVDKCWRKWTIQDAKDGDVLINWNNIDFIFKAIEDETVKFHIAYNERWAAIKTPSTKLSHLGTPEPKFKFHPATKEQRDTLMKAMADAGYTFDFEKKELKKIEQKPAWSGDDREMRMKVLKYLSTRCNVFEYEEVENWLNSIKDRVQPQPKWKPSDEQLKSLKEVIDVGYFTSYPFSLETLYEQLKKLKEQ